MVVNTVVHIIRIIVLAAIVIHLLQAIAFLSAYFPKDQFSGILRKVWWYTLLSTLSESFCSPPAQMHCMPAHIGQWYISQKQ